jgi:anaerobic selenocysteine-containing dehydrogenase
VPDEVKVKRTFCGFCEWAGHCGILVHVKDDEVIKVEGDPNSPFHPFPEAGKLCPKGMSAVEWHYHPGRLNYPLKRVGERGEGKWKRITWDQALDEIAEKLKEIRERYGPEALATLGGTGRSCGDYLRLRFQNLYGSPNWAQQGIICWGISFIVESLTYGWFARGMPLPGVTRCIVIWGLNPAHSSLPIYRRILDCVKEGAKLVVIDPRETELAKRADIWLQPRPGTDGALALAMINIIINEGLYDKDFVDKWCYGFDRLKERVKEYTPDKVSEITWVPAEKIIEAARMYATNKPATIPWGVKNDQVGRGVAGLLRAKAILKAITGNLDVEGGETLGGPKLDVLDAADLELNEKISPEQLRKQLGSGRFKVGMWPGWELIAEAQRRVWKPEKVAYIPRHECTAVPMPLIWRAILTGKPYPIKAIICQCSNPLVAAPNAKLVYEALRSSNLELFVVHDHVMTPSAMLADYVLPAADYLERTADPTHLTIDLSVQVGYNVVIGGERPVKPLYERKTDFEFWRDLCWRFGYQEYFPWQTEEELWDYCLKGLNITFQELCRRKENWLYAPPIKYRKHEEIDPATGKPKGFATPTGKVELYSTILEKLDYDPLPYYVEPPESPVSRPDLAKEYPLILITGARFRYMFHSEYRQLAPIRKITPDPLVEIHPDTARELGINDGDWVWIETRVGRVRQRAKLTTGIHPKVVSAQHGWWFPEKPGEEPSLFGVFESNINVCVDDDPDKCSPEFGAWPLSPLLCKIYKA